MTINQALENYLSKLDKSLNSLSISDRAEIVTEIKSHVLDAIEQDPKKSVDQILSSLGQPEQVASRYLMEKGLSPVRPPIHPIVKWATIGFLGTVGMILLFATVLVFKFSPIIDVDEESGRVEILGGLIKVDEGHGRFVIGGVRPDMEDDHSLIIAGVMDNVKAKKLNQIELNFTNGKMGFAQSKGDSLTWHCKTKGTDDQGVVVQDGNTIRMNLDRFTGSKCEVEVPEKMNLIVRGGNGKIEIEKPKFNVDVELSNGKVDIESDHSMKYKYDTRVVNGMNRSKLNIKSSNDPNALKVRVSLTNGVIRAN